MSLSHAIAQAFSRQGLPVASADFSAVVRRPLAGAKTVLITALPYYFPTTPEQNLARFAALPDYHVYFGARLHAIARELSCAFPAYYFQAYTDHSPIDEKQAAVLSGLAVKGKNQLCITNEGSFVFLGEVITDAVVSLSALTPPRPCDGCNACFRACPSGALREGEFILERCISHITQKKGKLTPIEQALLRRGGSAWGCDRCAEACPRNRGLCPAEISLPPNTLLRQLHHADVDGLSDRGFREHFSGRAFVWRGKAPLLRNLKLLEGED